MCAGMTYVYRHNCYILKLTFGAKIYTCHTIFYNDVLTKTIHERTSGCNKTAKLHKKLIGEDVVMNINK
jgi:hypothetical protein